MEFRLNLKGDERRNFHPAAALRVVPLGGIETSDGRTVTRVADKEASIN